MTDLPPTNKLIVSAKDGRGVFTPFPKWDRHTGESFWVNKKEYKVGVDNRVQIPKTDMKKLAEEAGFIREDGRFAIAMQMSAFEYKTKRAFGGVVVRNEKLQDILENGENGQLISNEYMKTKESDGDKRLLVMDYKEPYRLYTRREM